MHARPLTIPSDLPCLQLGVHLAPYWGMSATTKGYTMTCYDCGEETSTVEIRVQFSVWSDTYSETNPADPYHYFYCRECLEEKIEHGRKLGRNVELLEGYLNQF